MRNLTVKLCHVDPMRTGFYRDLWSKLLCETAVSSWWANEEVLTSGDEVMTSREGVMTSQDVTVTTTREPLRLSKKYLTQLHHADYMFALHVLDLSHNNMTTLACFSSLVSLQKLNISDNKLTSLEGIEHCKNLDDLDASDNSMINACGILPVTKCRLTTLSLVGNPLVDTDQYPSCITESCIMLCKLDGREL